MARSVTERRRLGASQKVRRAVSCSMESYKDAILYRVGFHGWSHKNEQSRAVYTQTEVAERVYGRGERTQSTALGHSRLLVYYCLLFSLQLCYPEWWRRSKFVTKQIEVRTLAILKTVMKQESRAIAWKTARCRCIFRYLSISNFSTASYVRLPYHSSAFLLSLCLQTAVNNLLKSN